MRGSKWKVFLKQWPGLIVAITKALFNPAISNQFCHDRKKYKPVQELVKDAILDFEPDMKKEMLSNIVLIGTIYLIKTTPLTR